MGDSLPTRPLGQISDDPVTDSSLDASVIALLKGAIDLLGQGGGPAAAVDVLSIAAGDNNIGNVDVLSIAAGTNNIGDVDIASIAAGETHIGSIGGHISIVTPTITVSTSPAYSSGDSIGGKITLTSAMRVSGGTAVLQSLVIADRAGQAPTGQIIIFNSDPTAATLTDNSALDLSTDDFNVVAVVPIVSADYATVNGRSVAAIGNIGMTVRATSGTTLYAAWHCSSTPTFAATTNLQVKFGFLQD